MNDRAGKLRRRFAERFATSADAPRLFRAPGRVNLIGEHTDYNDGLVMPLAIGWDTWVLVSPRTDGRLWVDSLDFDECVLHALGAPSEHAKGSGHWSLYVLGVAECLRDAGYTFGGANLLIHSTVPMGAGLSSSAALEVSVCSALLSLVRDRHPSKLEWAEICQRAEHDYVGTRCGIMDQYASVHGVEGHALQLDCRTKTHIAVPLEAALNAPFEIVICNTMVRHQLASGEYNRRRQDCEAAIACLSKRFPAVRALRDVSDTMLKDGAADLSPQVLRRARHVVSENLRVESMAAALRCADYGSVGALMAQSHVSLRDDYEVSCPELDAMVAIAGNLEGVLGARMTGGGFGGCTINLVQPHAVARFQESVRAQYATLTGREPEIYVAVAANGAGEMDE